MKMSTRQKGCLALRKAQARALAKGIITSTPDQEVRYDLLLDDGKEILRAQVKYGGGKTHSGCSGAVVANLETIYKNGSSVKRQRYTVQEIDLVLVYVPDIDGIVALGPELFAGKRAIQIRLEPPKNNQKLGVVLAEEHLW